MNMIIKDHNLVVETVWGRYRKGSPRAVGIYGGSRFYVQKSENETVIE